MAPGARRYPTPAHDPASLDYILEEVFRFPPDSILAQALAADGCINFLDLISYTEEDIETLVYPVVQAPSHTGDPVPDVMTTVSRPIRAHLHGLLGYLYYRKHHLSHPVTPANCMEIDPDDFDLYRCSGEFLVYRNNNPPSPPAPKSTRTPAQEFDRNIKLDSSAFPKLDNEKQWDNYQRTLTSLCRSHGLLNVLDKTYMPIGDNAIKLFDRHQSYLYHIFVSTLRTDHGKRLVREFEATYDAQSVYARLSDHATKSVKADINAANLMTYLTTTKLTSDSWPGSHEGFILHWLEQVRQHNVLDPANAINENLQKSLLESALHFAPHLQRVKGQADILARQTNMPLTFDAYQGLLIAEAQTYDSLHSSKGRSRPRKAYATDISNPPDDDVTSLSFNIDMDVADYQVFQSRQTNSPRIPMAQWQQLDTS